MEKSVSGAITVQTPMGEERIIPASRRPDGSLRKAIKIRQGYVAQEEVQTFRPSKAPEKLAPGQVIGMPVVVKPVELPKSKNQKRNEKKRLQKILALAEEATVEPRKESVADEKKDKESINGGEALEKKLKNLRKKQRQIEEIEAKAKAGTELNADQQEKLSKKESIQSEIDQLMAEMESVRV